jgi:hypothetical protein
MLIVEIKYVSPVIDVCILSYVYTFYVTKFVIVIIILTMIYNISLQQKVLLCQKIKFELRGIEIRSNFIFNLNMNLFFSKLKFMLT